MSNQHLIDLNPLKALEIVLSERTPLGRQSWLRAAVLALKKPVVDFDLARALRDRKLKAQKIRFNLDI